jgi:hypothetical protein
MLDAGCDEIVRPPPELSRIFGRTSTARLGGVVAMALDPASVFLCLSYSIARDIGGYGVARQVALRWSQHPASDHGR